MGAISGKFGTVWAGASELAEVYMWRLARKANVQRQATNMTGGFKRPVAGTRTGDLSVSGDVDPDDMVDSHFQEGDSITFLGYIDETNFYTIPAVVESLDMEVDIDDGKIVGWNMAAAAWNWLKPCES